MPMAGKLFENHQIQPTKLILGNLVMKGYKDNRLKKYWGHPIKGMFKISFSYYKDESGT
jgi:hypothetical protein